MTVIGKLAFGPLLPTQQIPFGYPIELAVDAVLPDPPVQLPKFTEPGDTVVGAGRGDDVRRAFTLPLPPKTGGSGPLRWAAGSGDAW